MLEVLAIVDLPIYVPLRTSKQIVELLMKKVEDSWHNRFAREKLSHLMRASSSAV